eukprot:jgi/Mesen1/3136/ME000184S02204
MLSKEGKSGAVTMPGAKDAGAKKKEKVKHEEVEEKKIKKRKPEDGELDSQMEAYKKSSEETKAAKKDAVKKWEQMRQRDIEPEKSKKLAADIMASMKGRLAAVALSHTTSRVLQACMKQCPPADKEAAFAELLPHVVELASDTYARHLVKAMLKKGSKKQVEAMTAQLRGHVTALLRHPFASDVMETAYQMAKGPMRSSLVAEFYSPDFRLFKGLEVLEQAAPAQRRGILEHTAAALQPILEKGIVDHSIVHRVLADFLAVAPKAMQWEVVQALSGPPLLRMLHTRPGAICAAHCIALGSAKERKKIVKAFKGHVADAARDDCGHLMILAELMADVLGLALHKHGSRVLLHLLAPYSSKYFAPDVLAALQPPASQASPAAAAVAGQEEEEKEEEVAAVNGDGDGKGEEGEEGGAAAADEPEMGVSRKDAEALAEACEKHAGALLRSPSGCDVIFEVANGGAGAILWKAVPEMLPRVHAAIAAAAALPRTHQPPPSDAAAAPAAAAPASEQPAEKKKKKKKEKQPQAQGQQGPGPHAGEEAAGGKNAEGGKAEEHVMEEFWASRTLRRLLLQSSLPPPEESGGAESVCSVLWKRALSGRCREWAFGHSLKVVAALPQCADPAVRATVMKELQPLIADGTIRLREGEQSLPVGRKQEGGEGTKQSGKAAAAAAVRKGSLQKKAMAGASEKGNVPKKAAPKKRTIEDADEPVVKPSTNAKPKKKRATA